MSKKENNTLRILDKIEISSEELFNVKNSDSLLNRLKNIDGFEEDKKEIKGLMEILNYSLRQDINTKENYYTLFKPKNVNGLEDLGVISNENGMVLFFLAEMGLHVRCKSVKLIENIELEINNYKILLNHTVLALKDLDYFNKVQLLTQLDNELEIHNTSKLKVKL